MPKPPAATSAVESLIAHARRRVLFDLILDKASLALTVFLGGAILLLILGTQILDWYWLVILAAAALGVGLYRLRGRVPSLYEIAQKLDRRMRLADALSTAFYFLRNPDPQRPLLCQRQQRDAEMAAAQVDLKTALPYTRSRYLIPAAGLAVVAVVLFGIRYASTGTISLSDSMFRIAADSFFASPTEVAKNESRKPGVSPQPFTPGQQNAKQENAAEELPESLMENPQEQNSPESQPDMASKDASNADASAKDQKGQPQEGDQNKGDQQQDSNNDDSGNSSDNGNQDGKQGKPKNDSMLDKIRDALANMMNQMKSDKSAKQSQNTQKGQPQKSEDADRQKADNGSGESSTADAGQKKDQPSKEQNDAKGGQNPNKPTSQEASNSMGDKVGDKALKDAQALEAMGKISELIGKRAQNLTGEMMVEVGSTKQQLKTQWSTKDAAHSDTGGQIHRDEVPLMYQQFVEQYFDEIRKSPAPAAKPAPNHAN